ncbi:MAG TPA: hypothetical protein VHK22_05590 [Gaiellaceae bacterium]|nr:hypothetical protein [Gaiellaceae bacterium]
MRLSFTVVVAALAALAAGGGVPGYPLPSAPSCPVFPETNVWNKRVDRLPVAKNSATIIRSIGRNGSLHPDFGSGRWDGGPIGIPVTVVDSRTEKVRVRFGYADESDKGPYPIPYDVKIEGGRRSDGDRHALIVDRDACRLYELFALHPRSGNPPWRAGSGAIWDLRSNALRPRGWTSADAAGLPILPGLVRWSEIWDGEIDHALRFTVERTRRAYVYPARHYASDLTSRALPPMGLRLRLRSNFPVAGFPRQARIVLVALKRYGMIVADNGSSWYVQGEPNANWSNDALHELHRVKGSDFRVVDTSGLRNG